MLTSSLAIPDTGLPASSSRHLSMIEKPAEMPPPTAFCRNLVVQRFACPTNWSSFLFYLHIECGILRYRFGNLFLSVAS